MFGKGRQKRDVEQKLHDLDSKMAAIGRSQAVIEFDLDGRILDANDNLLTTMGYSLDEIRGQHHRTFMDPTEAADPAYAAFWRDLNAGRFVATKFRRLAKGGREVWLQASYNPVMGPDGRPSKVIKLAVDITEAEQEFARREAERLSAEAAQNALVEALAGSLARLSDGDLTARIEQEMSGAHGQVKSDFNNAVECLGQTLAQVLQSVSGLRGGSDEISSASDDLSRRTEQQAASLEETAAALDEITATVKRSAEGARQAAAVAGEARGQADRSGAVVREAVAAMDGIRKSSDQISDIIGVIDEIAFQTNLLALNAGVEAARAGDAGRGFAVVASEVRALAQRSAEAAKEIKALIGSSTERVNQGVRLVDDTGQALTRIIDEVAQISGLVADIAASAREQATGLGEINVAVNQMDQMTQQNAAMVEESTAASHSRAQETTSLADLMGRFRIRAETAPAARPAPPPRTVTALKTVGGRGLSAVPAASTDDWEEF
ncbi:methyl-accepting chemotaxis protein [Brevundimonas sp.]|uniref:methyl-accepting chemotaxis protein n=1 Tax=Brevundimonas sp. TaxID=1871086 RepID=UPI0028AD5A8D|nr:methyl-accepting chemotaxis protein [Brevundimonas sp.]